MSIRTRIALAFGVLVVAVAAITGLVVYQSLATGMDHEVDRALLNAARSFATSPPPLGQPGAGGPQAAPGRPRPLVPTRALPPGAVIERIDLQGDVTRIGGTSAVELETQALPIDLSAQGDTAASLAVGDSVLRVVTVPDQFGRGQVRATRDISYVDSALQEARRTAFGVSIGGGLLAALVGWLLAAVIVRPLRRLTDTASGIAETGSTDARVQVEGSSETARLARAFNEMLDSLAAARAAQVRLLEDAAHELRTPLTSIRANASMLEHFVSLSSADQASLIADLQDESAELGDLVEQALVLTSSRAVPEMVLVDVAELCRQVADRYSRAGVAVTVSGEGSTVGDAALLRRAVANLIGNASKFAPGGKIEVVVDCVGDMTRVSVLDDGPGFAAGTQARAFDRFWRDDSVRDVPGSGLGLSIVADIAERHGGSAEAANRPEGGACVMIRLPRAVS